VRAHRGQLVVTHKLRAEDGLRHMLTLTPRLGTETWRYSFNMSAFSKPRGEADRRRTPKLKSFRPPRGSPHPEPRMTTQVEGGLAEEGGVAEGSPLLDSTQRAMSKEAGTRQTEHGEESQQHALQATAAAGESAVATAMATKPVAIATLRRPDSRGPSEKPVAVAIARQPGNSHRVGAERPVAVATARAPGVGPAASAKPVAVARPGGTFARPTSGARPF
jgi:hypothetical protein